MTNETSPKRNSQHCVRSCGGNQTGFSCWHWCSSELRHKVQGQASQSSQFGCAEGQGSQVQRFGFGLSKVQAGLKVAFWLVFMVPVAPSKLRDYAQEGALVLLIEDRLPETADYDIDGEKILKRPLVAVLMFFGVKAPNQSGYRIRRHMVRRWRPSNGMETSSLVSLRISELIFARREAKPSTFSCIARRRKRRVANWSLYRLQRFIWAGDRK